MPETSVEERLESQRDYEDVITHVTIKLRDEFEELLQGAGDPVALVTLQWTALSAYLGFGKLLDDDEDMQEHDDETEEELRAKSRVHRAFTRLYDLEDDVQEAIDALQDDALQDKPATVADLVDYARKSRQTPRPRPRRKRAG